jgi:hypothetical protein
MPDDLGVYELWQAVPLLFGRADRFLTPAEITQGV